MQLAQAPAVTADAKVAIVAIEHLTQAFALQFKRPMPHEPALLIERLERTRKAIVRCELLHDRVPLPRCSPDMAEPEDDVGNDDSPLSPGPRRGRKSTRRVLSGCNCSPNLPSRFPSTASTRPASSLWANSITKSSQNRTSVLGPRRRGCTVWVNHSSTTW